MTYKIKIIFIALICFIITLMIHGILNYSEAKKSSLEQTEINLKMSSNALTDYIDLWMESKKGGLEIVARHLANLQGMSKEQIQEILQETTKTLDGVDTTIGLEDGTAFTGTGKPLPEGYDPRIRPWYKLFKSTGKVNVTDAYIDPITQLICVSVAAPIYKDGIFLGGIVLDLSLDFFTKSTSDVNFKGGYGILLDSQKTIIAHPNKEIHAKSLKEFLPHLFSQINQDYGLIEYPFENKKHIFAYKISKETGWIPGIIYDKEESYRFLNTQIKDIIITTVSILIVFGIVVSIFIKTFMIQRSNNDGKNRDYTANTVPMIIINNNEQKNDTTINDYLLQNIYKDSLKITELTKAMIHDLSQKHNFDDINQLKMINNKIYNDIKKLT